MLERLVLIPKLVDFPNTIDFILNVIICNFPRFWSVHVDLLSQSEVAEMADNDIKRKEDLFSKY